ncbi:hypothetical protein Nepgr_013654 [Nepenthes gracilis]|uniref:Peptidase A1 domain-containing protein n=1 Tax=Nepenthes gracilis TaxID=150966 RepID=A0AAD3SIC5_NEPGR|nr:hypothetical protein Nepgr_013654 [Nepenthes gracilis]
MKDRTKPIALLINQMSASTIWIVFLGGFLLLCLSSCCIKASDINGSRGTEHLFRHSHTIEISSLLPVDSCKPSSRGNKHGASASLEVVHRYGPCSKLSSHKPSHTEMLLQDQARVDSIQSRVKYESDRDRGPKRAVNLPAKSGSTIGSASFIVTVGFGKPIQPQSLIFDTGSDLTWIQCEPCEFCYEQQGPIFDPSKSTSYSDVACGSECDELASANGNAPVCRRSATSTNNLCYYYILYGDYSYSVGVFAKDELTLTRRDAVRNFPFGCGVDNEGLFGGSGGLLGLGMGKLSFVSQTADRYGKRFSYCLPSNPSSTGYLTFGRDGRTRTPKKYVRLLKNSEDQSFYFVMIEAIKVGRRRLSISPSVFREADTIIDSGTVVTRLPPAAYAALREAVERYLSRYPKAAPLSILDTCFDFNGHKRVKVPKVRLYFLGGAKVTLRFSGTFYVANASQVCLAFAGNQMPSDLAIVGSFQQTTFDVSYDVAGRKLGFAAGGCD